ncbi:hypothetical protein A1O7_08044 [Cladophialophora yegresii CBS 114405]|uniref:F-box domain-containing protein n=1 Tax=Cladophialophora yegresii CBS 114405 TaxID=1182544 RepID=W9W982_9EURO|nr:uncharacterized protein A1O7_08044 [Cladophialophora yegresii CBS 114405]EXJ55119.1 hypothetical protein A1O7_08044 [Cladophialophora yegresii CBS 114405]
MPSWKDGLVNAFPIPQDHGKRYSRKDKQNGSTLTEAASLVKTVGTLTLEGGPFPFFDLPAEIRNRIYRLILFSKPGYRLVDGRLRPCRTAIMATNKRTHQEAAYVLYSTTSFRIFPLQDFTPAPVIQELRPMYRAMLTKMEVTVGSSWTSPPKSWRVSKLLAKRLSRLSAVQTLKVFVELDPSLPMFEKYRVSLDFYTDFCGDLLRDVLLCVPQVTHIEMDGNPGVEATGPLVTRLRKEAESTGKTCTIGPTKALATPAGVKRMFFQ